jgi:hypothetical protein
MLILFFSLFLSNAHAQIFQGPVSSALGGSGRAGLDANEGAALNPALVPLQKSEATGYFRDGQLDSGQHLNSWGASLSETQDVLLPGELTYLKIRNTGSAPAAVDGDLWSGSIGYLFFKRLAVGVTLYHLGLKEVGQPLTEQWNGALGGLFLITPTFGVAYVLDNPVHAASSIPVGMRQLMRQSVGLFYSSEYNARFRLDFVRQEAFNPNKRIDVRGGIETEVSDYMVFRIGGRADETQEQRFITAGLGFEGPKLKIDYSFEKNVERTSGAVHSVDMRITF